ncbi:hypothetical protein ACHAXS_000599 [Conticribra weissflogii]
MVAFYYLLRIGEYTMKATQNMTKQTVLFKLEDTTFFKKNAQGQLKQLPRLALVDKILLADGATLKLDNQKNGWKGVCVYQESTGDKINNPVKALARQYVHIRTHTSDFSSPLSAYFVDGKHYDLTNKDVSAALKLAATLLEYPTNKGIPIERVDTHSLCSGGTNALSLSGFSDTQIQKIGRWQGATFKEYIREELACFSTGMSKAMSRTFNFVNIAGGVFHDVTSDVMMAEYNTTSVAA